jgi:hypothetical protein
MKRQRVFAVSAVVLALSGSVFLMAGERMAQAAPTPSLDDWDNNLHGSARFTVLPAFGNHAVRDNNTGLVWEQAPDATPRDNFFSSLHCLTKVVGGTTGWRMPSVVELKSVQDPALPEPFVPTSVFTGIQPDNWSATVSTYNPNATWFVGFGGGYDNANISERSSVNHVWCVRGPMNDSAY